MAVASACPREQRPGGDEGSEVQSGRGASVMSRARETRGVVTRPGSPGDVAAPPRAEALQLRWSSLSWTRRRARTHTTVVLGGDLVPLLRGPIPATRELPPVRRNHPG
jgi:hypothetical protein